MSLLNESKTYNYITSTYTCCKVSPIRIDYSTGASITVTDYFNGSEYLGTIKKEVRESKQSYANGTEVITESSTYYIYEKETAPISPEAESTEG